MSGRRSDCGDAWPTVPRRAGGRAAGAPLPPAGLGRLPGAAGGPPYGFSGGLAADHLMLAIFGGRGAGPPRGIC